MSDVRENLPHILEEHRKWCSGDGGARANLARANLARANLARANLAGAYLTGADLATQHVVDGGQRFDGYRFVGWIKNGNLMIRAGCRNMTVMEYREHNATRADTKLRDETDSILDHIERVARVRGLTKEAAL